MTKRFVDLFNGFLLGIVSGAGALFVGMLYGKIIMFGYKISILSAG